MTYRDVPRDGSIVVSVFAVIGPFVFALVGLVLVILLYQRKNQLSRQERNAVVTASMGLFLCGRYALTIHYAHDVLRFVLDWLWVTAIAAMMISLARSNLGKSLRRNTSGRP